MTTTNDTHVPLSRSLKIRLLKAVQEGQIDLALFPELKPAREAVQSHQIAQLSPEEKEQCLEVAILLSNQITALGLQQEGQPELVTLDKAVGVQLLQALQTGQLDLLAFPQLIAAEGVQLVEISGFTAEQQRQIRQSLRVVSGGPIPLLGEQ